MVENINKNADPGLTSIKIASAGAISGALTRATLQPFDVLKIRFQLQSSGNKYTSIYQAIRVIYVEEGPKAFWKGHVPAQALSIVYGVCQFSTWEYLNKFANTYNHTGLNKILTFGAGAAGGIVATTVSFPFDVLRTRLVAQSTTLQTYDSMFQALRIIPKSEGYKTFYKGLYPALIQIIPYAGTQFLCYKIFNEFCDKVFGINWVISGVVVSGSLSGFCAKVVVYPLDLCKKRLQIQGMERWVFSDLQFNANGLTQCFLSTVRLEGFLGLYKGFFISAIKACVVSGVSFAIYESSLLVLKSVG